MMLEIKILGLVTKNKTRKFLAKKLGTFDKMARHTARKRPNSGLKMHGFTCYPVCVSSSR